MWEALGEYSGPPVVKVLIRYVAARMYKNAVETSYRAYVTDSLRLIPQMSYLVKSWSDTIREAQSPVSRMTAEEIADDVISRLEGA